MYINIGKRIDKVDNYILFVIKKYGHNRYLDIIMPMATFMGTLGILWIVIAADLVLDKQYRAIGITIILTLIISTIVGEGIIKHLVRRARPCNKQDRVNLLIPKPISYSFPSGHTLSSFAVAEMLSMYFTEYKFIFIAIAFLIAISRLYLYVHYPTDVVAGIIIGIICSKLIFTILTQGFMERLAVFYQNLF